MSRQPLDTDTIVSRLDDYLEAEFTFIRTDQLAAVLAGMPRDRQDFVLEWTRRAAATNTELAFQFANRAKEALLDVEPEVVSAWWTAMTDPGCSPRWRSSATWKASWRSATSVPRARFMKTPCRSCCPFCRAWRADDSRSRPANSRGPMAR